MKIFQLDKMFRGWFLGNFAPGAMQTSSAKVAVKRYEFGNRIDTHVHKMVTEITLVREGTVVMRDRRKIDGGILKLAPGETTDFSTIADATTVVVNIPPVIDDKNSSQSRRRRSLDAHSQSPWAPHRHRVCRA